MKVTVYDKENCAKCKNTEMFLKNKGVEFETKDVLEPENADVNAVSKSTVGVFLIDVNNLDMGLFIEMGILVAQNKPIIAVMLDSKGTFNNDYAGNLMLTQAGTYFTKDISDLEHYDFNRTPGNTFNDLGDNFIVI